MAQDFQTKRNQPVFSQNTHIMSRKMYANGRFWEAKHREAGGYSTDKGQLQNDAQGDSLIFDINYMLVNGITTSNSSTKTVFGIGVRVVHLVLLREVAWFRHNPS
jgi:hypothetical protein